MRQTDVRQHHRLMPPPKGRGHNNHMKRQGSKYVIQINKTAFYYPDGSDKFSIVNCILSVLFQWLTFMKKICPRLHF